MELKNPMALYICAGVAAVFVILAFINIRFGKKYRGGKKAYLPTPLLSSSWGNRSFRKCANLSGITTWTGWGSGGSM